MPLPPLPSLFLRPTTPRDSSDAALVPPLRWRSPRNALAAETETTTETNASAAEELTTHETDSTTKLTSPRKRSRDVGKPASQLQREARDDLANEVRALETQLDALRRRLGLPTSNDKTAVEATYLSNVTLDEKLHERDCYVGRLDSKLTNELLLPAVNPMSTFIHLPHDTDQRRAILRSMQELKLRRGIEVATSWMHHLYPTVPYLSEENFTSATGEYHYHRLQIDQFPNFQTARQLYDVYIDFLYHLDVSITEEVGQLTLREETEVFDPTIWHHRILTVAEDVGITEELNILDFAHFYEHSTHTNSPMGVIVRDTVNIDERYPYEPDKRTCKDVQAVCLIYEVPVPGTPDETVVVLKDCAFAVQLLPQFPLAPHVLKQLHDNTSKWPRAFLQYLHGYVVPETDRYTSPRRSMR